jgi:hypothetical protein
MLAAVSGKLLLEKQDEQGWFRPGKLLPDFNIRSAGCGAKVQGHALILDYRQKSFDLSVRYML